MEFWKGTLEGMVIASSFWNKKKVFVTGHTGFKGSWLCLWLNKLGAQVTGYSLPPPTHPSLFEDARISSEIKDIRGDVRNYEDVKNALSTSNPEIIFHMAAQPLVRYSYNNTIETYSTNVMGTVHLLEAIRHAKNVKAAVSVTSDKCYENKEWEWGYRENEAMGGFDPYSNSKGCAELVTAAFRNSFFNSKNSQEHGTAIASARAGNVIGGGDWSEDRLIPDIIKSLSKNEAPLIRNPHSIRPWQHVLVPLSGYLHLAQKLYEDGSAYAEAWNFGPYDNEAKPVSWITDKLINLWDAKLKWKQDTISHPHEAHYLKLDSSKSKSRLSWEPQWNLEKALKATVDWYKKYNQKQDIKQFTLDQIQEYSKASND